ncbi:MAG: peptide-methionine (R)-S-oxide reductase MsrB [Bacteriovoracaceae bacterium]|jgi:peptide-methionine (R)-S-oxide reductase|nr:peptide-methionine (R)-S-oxide reductase MsrB [Bacteriovoracaceae bacterium]
MKKLDHLTKLQYEVTQNACTEPPFKNKYWNVFESGIYVDIIDETPLFHSNDKFESHCGWPSFSKPISEDIIVFKKDFSHGMVRLEVLSKSSGSHLGHIFEDGPAPLYTRYCINSASIKFIPEKKLSLDLLEKYF